MNLISKTHDQIQVITLDGDNWDAGTVQKHGRWLEEKVSGGDVILDMSRVAFADTSGLGLLCRLALLARSHKLGMTGLSPRLEAAMQRVPAHLLPTRYPCMVSAIQAMRQPSTPPDHSPTSADHRLRVI